MRTKNKSIGIEIKQPATICSDSHCPFHGGINIRGRIFIGNVIKAASQKTVTIEFPRKIFLKKYERYEKRRTRIKAHNPLCINAKLGDKVKIAECRPISKTKNFSIIEKL